VPDRLRHGGSAQGVVTFGRRFFAILELTVFGLFLVVLKARRDPGRGKDEGRMQPG
jgi:hypothetical protein